MVDKSKKVDFWYDKILYLKSLKNFYSKMEYKGINLWPVMATDVYPYYYFSHIDIEEEPKTKNKFLIGLKSLFLKDKFPLTGPPNKNEKILVSYFMPRKDHQELVEKAVSKFKKRDVVWIGGYKYKQKNIFLRSRLVFPNIFLLFNIWHRFRRANLKKRLKNYYWLYILITYYRYGQIKTLKKLIEKINPKAHIAFCSGAFAEEAIISLLCKKDEKPTFTLQHGFFYKSTDKFASPILLNENIVSEYHLVWGKSSYDIQKDYTNKEKILIVGNPKYKKPKIKAKPKFAPKKATIFFSVPGYNKGNFKLLKIMKKFVENHPEILFNLTVHPMNDINLFSKELNYKNVKVIDKSVLAQTLLEESDFVILYNTTVNIEALNYKIPIFKYLDEESLVFWEYPDKFSNLKEIEELFSRMKVKKEYKKLIRFYEKELNRIFYFHPKKNVPQVYYDKIMSIIKKVGKKN